MMKLDQYQKQRYYNLEREAREASNEAKDASDEALKAAERAENAADLIKQILDNQDKV